MVHENGLHSTSSQEGVVNSASLEDVQLNEPIDNRAQSIQSLHSCIETPTPDSTPSYDELQQRLDEYNRHIAHMSEQKNQLQRMHSDAKRHLMLLEQYQRECAEHNLSFDDKTKNGENVGQPPDYDSVDEVQSDMAILAQRVENITRLVDNQKQLINQLPDEDGVDLRANQAVLEQKLNDLKRNGNDLHLIAAELDTLNTTAAVATAAAAAVAATTQPTKIEEPTTPKATTATATENGMRVVPIQMTAAVAPKNQRRQMEEKSNAAPASAKSVGQKGAEVEDMRAELRRLRDLLGCIDAIEKIETPAKPMHVNQFNEDSSIDRDRTPTPASVAAQLNRERNLRILDNVSSDLRAESERNEFAQERIMSLQDHISRCSKQAAAAIQLGEDALKRHSATPTPTPASIRSQRSISPEVSSSSNTASELEREYIAKKQQFEEICRRINSTDINDEQKTALPSKRNDPETHEPVHSSSVSSIADDARSQANERINLTACKLDTTSTAASAEASTAIGGITSAQQLNDGLSFDASSNGGGSTFNSFRLPAALNLNANNGGGFNWAAGPPSWNLPGFRAPFISLPQNFNVPNFVPQSPISMPFGAAATAVTTGLPPTTGATNGWENSTLLQHCLQQQQIFGQALNQLYSIIWQQQREMEHLHRGIVVLQERLLRLGGESLAMHSDLGLDMNFRSESVPPSFNVGLDGSGVGVATTQFPPYLNMVNNGLDLNRAQSEQPHQHQHALAQQHYHHLHQQRQQQMHLNNLGTTNVGNVFNSEMQQQQTTQTASSVGGSSRIYSTLNNANVSAQQHQSYRTQASTASSTNAQQHHQDGNMGIGAAPPIFMHHHNNAIHQNNANLRRANVRSNISGGSNGGGGTGVAADANNSTLNNQVPPGNRTNNYWDNFRSYSRQNLFSTNLNKSNHVENQQQQKMLRRRCQQAPANFNYELEDDEEVAAGGAEIANDINCSGINDNGDDDDEYVAEDLSMRTILRQQRLLTPQQQQQQQQQQLQQQRTQQRNKYLTQELSSRRMRLNQQYREELPGACVGENGLGELGGNINVVGCACSNIDCGSKNIVSHNCLKNFQQRRQQQQRPQHNPLPLDAFITNSLHANGDVVADENSYPQTATTAAATAFYNIEPTAAATTTWLMNIDEQQPQQQQQQPLMIAANDLDIHFTTEMYGPNYEQHHHHQYQQHPINRSSSTSAAMFLLNNNNTLNGNERNVNFGNSPLNRQQHNKMPPKFQYRKGQCFGFNHNHNFADDDDDHEMLLNSNISSSSNNNSNHQHNNNNNNSNVHYRRFVGGDYETLPSTAPPPPPPPRSAAKRELEPAAHIFGGATSSYFNRYANDEFEAPTTRQQQPPLQPGRLVRPNLTLNCPRNLDMLPIYAYEYDYESQVDNGAEASALPAAVADKFGHSKLIEKFVKISNDVSVVGGVDVDTDAGEDASRNLNTQCLNSNLHDESVVEATQTNNASNDENVEVLPQQQQQPEKPTTNSAHNSNEQINICPSSTNNDDNDNTSLHITNGPDDIGACSLAAQLDQEIAES